MQTTQILHPQSPSRENLHHPILSELKQSLHQLYGARLKKLILLGSYARGQADTESDIDLLIVLDKISSLHKEIKKLVPLIATLNLKYGILVSCLPVSYMSYEQADTPFLMNISREGIPIYG